MHQSQASASFGHDLPDTVFLPITLWLLDVLDLHGKNLFLIPEFASAALAQ